MSAEEARIYACCVGGAAVWIVIMVDLCANGLTWTMAAWSRVRKVWRVMVLGFRVSMCWAFGHVGTPMSRFNRRAVVCPLCECLVRWDGLRYRLTSVIS